MEFSSQYQIVSLSTAGLLFLLERVGALQRDSVEIGGRWTANIGLLVIGSVAAAAVVPIGLYEFARAQPPGPLARMGMPMPLQIVLTFLLVDLYRFGEHRLFHRVPLFWRLHLVHHSDTQLDVTTAERHHPLELLLSTATMMALLRALGLPAAGFGLYLLLATAASLCSHANLRLPRPLDRLLRWLVVTPPVHAVHHSARQAHTNSNYGDVLTLWDCLFGTYADPDEVAIAHFGLEYFHQPGDTTLGRVLQQPFLFRSGMSYPARANAGPGPGLSGPGRARRARCALACALEAGAALGLGRRRAGPHGVEPTDAGHALLEHARVVRDDTIAAERRIHWFRAQPASRLAIGIALVAPDPKVVPCGRSAVGGRRSREHQAPTDYDDSGGPPTARGCGASNRISSHPSMT